VTPAAASLDLVLTPNRSLSRVHARWLVLGVGGIFFLGGLRFLVLGAWPIIPFMIADVALLWWALRSNFLSGGGHERLVLAGDALDFTRVSPVGAEWRVRLAPLFTRVEVEETPLGDAHVYLAERGRRVRVGWFLSAAERRDVGKVIAAALADYRSGASASTSSMP